MSSAGSDRPEHHLRGRVRGDDVRRHPALDQADGVEGRAEIGIDRQRQATQRDERVDELLDRRLALLPGPTSAPPGPAAVSRTRRTPRVAVASRLSVGSPLIRNRQRLGIVFAATAPSLPRSSPTTNSRPTRRSPARSQPLGRRDLRRQNPLRIARATANEPAILDPARKERRHTIEVRGEHHRRIVDRREDVGAAALDRLLGDVVAERAQTLREPAARVRLAAGRRIDVDERSRERDKV